MTEGKEKSWIIQRCINAFADKYENWPGYFERLMTREEMRVALEECNQRWPEYQFRGHNVRNQRKGLAEVVQLNNWRKGNT